MYEHRRKSGPFWHWLCGILVNEFVNILYRKYLTSVQWLSNICPRSLLTGKPKRCIKRLNENTITLKVHTIYYVNMESKYIMSIQIYIPCYKTNLAILIYNEMTVYHLPQDKQDRHFHSLVQVRPLEESVAHVS